MEEPHREHTYQSEYKKPSEGIETSTTSLEIQPSPLQHSSESVTNDAVPADLEHSTLPRTAAAIPLPAWTAIVAGAFERFTYFGLIAPWQNYMQHPHRSRNSPGSALPGALNLGQSTATNVSNAFFLTSFLTPMLFAALSDSQWGRYKTLMVGLGVYTLGCVLLTVTSWPGALETGAGVPGLAVAMVCVALGVGSVKACFVPFLGDQVVGHGDGQSGEKLERKSERLETVSREMTLLKGYNVYYWFTNVASLSSIPVTYLEHRLGFWQAYLLTTGVLVVGVLLFAIWGKLFVKVEPQGNVLPKAVKVLLCSAKNGFKLDHAKRLYPGVHHGRSISWSDDFVDEIRQGLVACKVLFSLVIFYLVVSQMYNNLVSQAGTMLLSGVPNDLPQAFSGVACIILGPPIQGLYTVLGRHRIPFGPIARLVTAFIFCGLSMAYAAVLQHFIYASPPCYARPLVCNPDAQSPNHISIFLQAPVYFLLAVGEILGFVTAFEYAYSKAPKEMKAVVMAFSQLTAGLASALGMAISPAAKDPNMVIMYAALAGTAGTTAGVFWWWFRELDQDSRSKLENEENEGQAGPKFTRDNP